MVAGLLTILLILGTGWWLHRLSKRTESLPEAPRRFPTWVYLAVFWGSIAALLLYENLGVSAG